MNNKYVIKELRADDFEKLNNNVDHFISTLESKYPGYEYVSHSHTACRKRNDYGGVWTATIILKPTDISTKNNYFSERLWSRTQNDLLIGINNEIIKNENQKNHTFLSHSMYYSGYNDLWTAILVFKN